MGSGNTITPSFIVRFRKRWSTRMQQVAHAIVSEVLASGRRNPADLSRDRSVSWFGKIRGLMPRGSPTAPVADGHGSPLRKVGNAPLRMSCRKSSPSALPNRVVFPVLSRVGAVAPPRRWDFIGIAGSSST